MARNRRAGDRKEETDMKRKIFIALSLLSMNILAASAQGLNMESDTVYRQHTSWGVAAGPNMMSYRINLESAQYAPDAVKPSVGADIEAFLNYHITERWKLRLTTAVDMDHVRLIIDDKTAHLLSYGADVAAMVSYNLPLSDIDLLFSAGPFTHFVFWNHISDDINFVNPYSRIIGNDPRTNEPRFAMGDFNAGIALAIGVETSRHVIFQLGAKYGISDLLNSDSQRLYIRPLKITLSVGYHFQPSTKTEAQYF